MRRILFFVFNSDSGGFSRLFFADTADFDFSLFVDRFAGSDSNFGRFVIVVAVIIILVAVVLIVTLNG